MQILSGTILTYNNIFKTSSQKEHLISTNQIKGEAFNLIKRTKKMTRTEETTLCNDGLFVFLFLTHYSVSDPLTRTQQSIRNRATVCNPEVLRHLGKLLTLFARTIVSVQYLLFKFIRSVLFNFSDNFILFFSQIYSIFVSFFTFFAFSNQIYSTSVLFNLSFRQFQFQLILVLLNFRFSLQFIFLLWIFLMLDFLYSFQFLYFIIIPFLTFILYLQSFVISLHSQHIIDQFACWVFLE